MRYCAKCGREIPEGAAFCSACGAPVETQIPAPAAPPAFNEEAYRKECAFLETTHRLLRWEQNAWSIASKVFIIVGIVFAAFFMLFFLIGLIVTAVGESYGGGIFMVIGFAYALIFGGTFIALGIVSKKAGKKLPQYIDTVYTDFSLTYKRCGSVGMLIFSIIFGAVSPIFFIINFVRMKANRATIERIMKNQNVQR